MGTIRADDAAVNRLRLTTPVFFFTDQLTVWTFKPIAGYPSEFNEKFAVKGRRYLTIVSIPDRATAQYLDSYNPVITKVEGAASFLAANREDNDRNMRFVVTHMTIKHRRSTQAIVKSRSVVYFMQREDSTGRRRRGVVGAVYNSKRCKKTGRRFCTKLEMRIQGSARIALLGISTCVDAVRFRWRDYFKRVVRFYRVDPNRLDALERKRANRHEYRYIVSGWDQFKRRSKVVLDGETHYCVQQFTQVVGHRNSALVELPVWSTASTAEQTKERHNVKQTQRHDCEKRNILPLIRYKGVVRANRV